MWPKNSVSNFEFFYHPESLAWPEMQKIAIIIIFFINEVKIVFIMNPTLCGY